MMEDQNYIDVRKEAYETGALDVLDTRYSIDINWTTFNPDEYVIEVSLGVHNAKTLDYLIIDGALTIQEKHYSFILGDTNNDKFNLEKYQKSNKIIDEFSAELKNIFEDKLDLIHTLMKPTLTDEEDVL